MQYFYTLDGNAQQGPVGREGLRPAGVGPQTMVWREGLGDWQAAGTLPELSDLFPPVPEKPLMPHAIPGGPAHSPYAAMPGGPLGYAPPQPGQGSNGLAVASMVCGIIGLLCCVSLIPAILAVVFGHIARGQISRGQGSGDGMAIAGLVMGYISLVMGVAYLVLSIIGAFIR